MNIDQNAPVITRDRIFISAPLDTVWDLFTDVNDWANWNEDIESATLDTPFAVGATFYWLTAGLQISSTVGELNPRQRVAWSGTSQDITGIHLWEFTPVTGGFSVQTEESWSGAPVEAQINLMQKGLDKSLRSWLENLKKEAEARSSNAGSL